MANPIDIDVERKRRLEAALDNHEAIPPSISDGDGGGTMNERVTRLETHMEYVRRDLDEIKGDLKTVVNRLGEMPTKGDLNAWKLQWTALVVAAIALIVGGIIGGLAWIQPAPSAPTPIVVQVPAQK